MVEILIFNDHYDFSFYVLGKHQEGIPETKEYCITWVGGVEYRCSVRVLGTKCGGKLCHGSNEVLLLVGWSLFLVRPKKNKATTSRRRSKEGKKKQEITIVRDKINRFLLKTSLYL